MRRLVTAMLEIQGLYLSTDLILHFSWSKGWASEHVAISADRKGPARLEEGSCSCNTTSQCNLQETCRICHPPLLLCRAVIRHLR